MKKTMIAAVMMGAAALCGPASAEDWVNGYTRRDGTQVQPHWRSDRDNDSLNNWSTRGNTNPHTGAVGTHDPYRDHPSTSPFGSTPRGGLFGSPLR